MAILTPQKAALFSAISTAFLIESTKLLQPDSAEGSARTLLVISQTLFTIVNGTQLPGSTPLPSSDPAEFTPSRAAIWVNVLWYLSLGLSLATSFIAILAKDWCHSFLGGRTGHPYLQTCRRQQKWDMIVKWKMSELLTILPSLIHVALLLFSVGLCIYLSDVHVAVAVPIFCATGAAVGFYVWSSIAAINIDHFPYPTVISRACRTDVARNAAQTLAAFASRFASHPLIRNLYQVAIALVFACAWILKKALYIPGMFLYPFLLLESPLDKCDAYLAHSLPLLRLMAVPLAKAARYLLWYPANTVLEWIQEQYEHLTLVEESIKSQLSDASWGLEWQERDPEARTQAGGDSSKQEDATSLALSWLITNCEVPQSVDIALQSIAGATSRTSRQPLLDCHATLEILRRLASSNVYKGSNARTDMIISLYSRALAWLGNVTGLASGTEQNGSGGELEGLIWDVHLESEKKVAASIVSGSFDPTRANLDALRIGNTAASNTLKLLGRDLQEAAIDTNQVLSSIVSLLESHVKQSEPLHEAALLSLVNAAALLLLFAPNSSAATALYPLCVNVIQLQLTVPTPHNLLLVNLAITCANLSSRRTDTELQSSPNNRSLLQEVVVILIEYYAGGTATLSMRSMFGLEALVTRSEAVQPGNIDLHIHETLLDQAALSVSELYSAFWTRDQGAGKEVARDSILQSFLAIHNPLSLVAVEPSRIFIPFLILVPIQYFWWSTRHPADAQWAELATNSRFPILSRTLVELVEKSDLISHLERIINGDDSQKGFIALGQLWLLLTIFLDESSNLADERERLGAQLGRYHQRHVESEAARHVRLGDQLVLMWESHDAPRGSLGGWPARLVATILQSRTSPFPEQLCHELQEYRVPENLRGLSSFTSWHPQLTETPELNDAPQPGNSIPPEAPNKNASNHDVSVQGIGETITRDKIKHKELGGIGFVGSDKGGTHTESGSGNITHGTTGGEGTVKSEGDTTALEEQGVGAMESGGISLGVEPGSVESGSGDNLHVLIDVHASEDATK